MKTGQDEAFTLSHTHTPPSAPLVFSCGLTAANPLPTLLLQKAISSPTVSRLTDTTKFTGSHKERFDPSGRGKGKAGRVDLVDESGYVPGYKHAGTYDQKVQGGK